MSTFDKGLEFTSVANIEFVVWGEKLLGLLMTKWLSWYCLNYSTDTCQNLLKKLDDFSVKYFLQSIFFQLVRYSPLTQGILVMRKVFNRPFSR